MINTRIGIGAKIFVASSCYADETETLHQTRGGAFSRANECWVGTCMEQLFD